MAKTASVFTRVDPQIKEQAEEVLEQLGISMSTAMEIYLRQIAMHKKIPFEMSLPKDNAALPGGFADERVNTLEEQSVKPNGGQNMPAKNLDCRKTGKKSDTGNIRTR